jgi:hypothetical protein
MCSGNAHRCASRIAIQYQVPMTLCPFAAPMRDIHMRRLKRQIQLHILTHLSDHVSG